MKNRAETTKWKRRYQSALRRYLNQGLPASLQPALKLGNEAAALGLETLDIALVHKMALAALVPDDDSVASRKRWEKQAKSFFAEAVIPIEKSHGASLKAAARVNKLTQVLQTRNAELTASTRLLAQSIDKRQKAEVTLDISGKNRRQLIKEAADLQALLHEKTCEVLTQHEKNSEKISLELRNEVAQTLLAIDLRLLALKTSAESNTQKLSMELDDTQRMVRESLKEIDGICL